MFRRVALFMITALLCATAFPQQYDHPSEPTPGSPGAPADPALYGAMKWRMIGPFRGGRTVPIVGIPDQPNVFFIGVNNGGVWKTTDYGQTWEPLFEGQPTQSVGALAVAPSDPNVIYVGSGEGLRRPDLSTGDGIYKSTDGGKTWTHLGLRDAQQIGAILIDPKDPNRIFVAALGHPYGPNAERGVFRSTDGGRTFQKVLYKDDDTGAIDLAFDPRDPQKIYAVLWTSRRPPWSVGNAYDAAGSGLYKSNDGGSTWQQIGQGLPTWECCRLGRIGIAIAPSDPNRMYAMVDSPSYGGVYRSDDAGATWVRSNTEERVWGRGSDFAWVRVDPKDKSKIYVANTSTYRSTDGGLRFTAFKGAPGGDDYHAVWINPNNPDIVALASDQGATISVNANSPHPTWSSWYNQPTAQFYHVIADDQFPYWVYGAQQESGSVGISSRSDYGEITFRDWTTVGVEEYGYVAPDPLDPNIVYGGKATRWDRRTHQVQNISPAPIRSGKFRFVRTAPIIFSTVDKHALYLGSNVLFKTTNGGHSWDIISPDLTRQPPAKSPANLGKFVEQDPAKGVHGGVIYSIGPSFRDANTIWIGTDDGLIQVTRDGGKTWQNVTPPEMTEWSKVAQIEASHFDNQSAYAAVNRFRLDDLKPYIYRTHDGGKSWQKIVNGIPDGASVNTVREDPQRKGLLVCGTENGVWVSFDDGDHWQSLQMNLPRTSVRDLVIHGDDVVVGTHGRSFWILDDITPLRQMSAEVRNAAAYLFKPQQAIRVKRSTNTDTPFPPEVPHGQNPPDGAIIDYTIGSGTNGPVALEIADASGHVVRRYSSDDKPEPVNPKDINVPTYWVRQPRVLESGAGMHRWVWDLHETPPESVEHEYPISAIVGDTPRYPLGASVPPGQYTVRLTAGGKTLTQPLMLRMDPRVTPAANAIGEQYRLEQKITAAMNQSYDALQQVKALREQLKGKDALKDVDARAAEFEGVARRRGGGENFAGINGSLAGLLGEIDGADTAPTLQQTQAVDGLIQTLSRLMTEWKTVEGEAQQKLK